VQVERIGETLPIDGGGALALVRAPALRPGSKVMATHLPNAVDGLKVQEVGEAQGLTQTGAGAGAGARP